MQQEWMHKRVKMMLENIDEEKYMTPKSHNSDHVRESIAKIHSSSQNQK